MVPATLFHQKARPQQRRCGDPHRPGNSGWIGTLDLPGFRADAVVTKLGMLPAVAPDHFYLDVLLLDGGGRTEDNRSGACPGMPTDCPLDLRSRFVRVVAELLAPAAADPTGLAGVGTALDLLRERGVNETTVVTAVRVLHASLCERAAALSMLWLLRECLGQDEARRTAREAVQRLNADSAGRRLDDHVLAVLRAVGKAAAWRYLSGIAGVELVPTAALLWN